MTSPIPESPQLRKKRRQNRLYLGVCLGATLAIMIYLFIPREEQQERSRSDHQPATSEQASHDPFAPPPSGSTPADIPDASADEAASDTTADEDAGPHDSELSESELAQLPPWEAEFMRLSREQRLAFASAFTRAKEAYNTKQWATCLVLLNDCELIYSSSPNVWNLRSCALLESGGLDEAQACIDRSLKLNPQDSVALMCQAELHMLRRDFAASISVLETLRQTYSGEGNQALHDTFTFHQLLCHLMLRQEMEARALVAELTPLTDSPLYYFAQAAFCVYRGESNSALEQLRSATAIYGSGGATASYRKWMHKCGLTEKYVRQ